MRPRRVAELLQPFFCMSTRKRFLYLPAWRPLVQDRAPTRERIPDVADSGREDAHLKGGRGIIVSCHVNIPASVELVRQ